MVTKFDGIFAYQIRKMLLVQKYLQTISFRLSYPWEGTGCERNEVWSWGFIFLISRNILYVGGARQSTF